VPRDGVTETVTCPLLVLVEIEVFRVEEWLACLGRKVLHEDLEGLVLEMDAKWDGWAAGGRCGSYCVGEGGGRWSWFERVEAGWVESVSFW
jgi:hypothetical protein